MLLQEKRWLLQQEAADGSFPDAQTRELRRQKGNDFHSRLNLSLTCPLSVRYSTALASFRAGLASWSIYSGAYPHLFRLCQSATTIESLRMQLICREQVLRTGAPHHKDLVPLNLLLASQAQKLHGQTQNLQFYKTTS